MQTKNSTIYYKGEVTLRTSSTISTKSNSGTVALFNSIVRYLSGSAFNQPLHIPTFLMMYAYGVDANGRPEDPSTWNAILDSYIPIKSTYEPIAENSDSLRAVFTAAFFATTIGNVADKYALALVSSDKSTKLATFLIDDINFIHSLKAKNQATIKWTMTIGESNSK